MWVLYNVLPLVIFHRQKDYRRFYTIKCAKQLNRKSVFIPFRLALGHTDAIQSTFRAPIRNYLNKYTLENKSNYFVTMVKHSSTLLKINTETITSKLFGFLRRWVSSTVYRPFVLFVLYYIYYYIRTILCTIYIFIYVYI